MRHIDASPCHNHCCITVRGRCRCTEALVRTASDSQLIKRVYASPKSLRARAEVGHALAHLSSTGTHVPAQILQNAYISCIIRLFYGIALSIPHSAAAIRGEVLQHRNSKSVRAQHSNIPTQPKARSCSIEKARQEQEPTCRARAKSRAPNTPQS